MCEKLTSHLFKVREREMLIAVICSHSETRAYFKLDGKDPNIVEVEWKTEKDTPDFRWSNQDEDERRLVSEWYSKRFPKRDDLIGYCLDKYKKGSLDLRGTKITKLPDNLTVGGSLNLRGTKITNVPKCFETRVMR